MELDFSEFIDSTDALRQTAVAALRKKVEKSPVDIGDLLQLAEMLRQNGALSEALTYYQRILLSEPENTNVQRLCAILDQQSLEGFSDSEISPVPFYQITDFLDARQQEIVWKTLEEHEDKFEDSGVGEGESERIDPDTRTSTVLIEDHLGDIKSWFYDKTDNAVNEAWVHLSMQPFSIDRREMQLTRHTHGGYYKVHRDSGIEEKTVSRTLTYVYYLHKLPKQFSGGDLLLFDTDTGNDRYQGPHTRIEPVCNSIVFFPSQYYHQVTPLTSDAKEFLDGRFTLNGWFHPKRDG